MYQGSKGGKTYVPLEVDGRIIGQSTPKFAKQVSSKYGDIGSRKVQKDLAENDGRKVSRKYIQDISQQVGQAIQTISTLGDSWTYTLPQTALEAKTISLGIDGTTSYLIGDGYRETMSGTISFFDADSNRVHTIYLAQTPEYGKSTFKERFEQEVKRVKMLCSTAHYTAVADGAPDNWTFLPLSRYCYIRFLAWYTIFDTC